LAEARKLKPEARFEEPWMEALTRLVADSLARHGLDRPVDPRRLQWSRWFRCDSPRSLLVVPSKPGIFALAEEIAGNVARAPSPATSSASDVLGSGILDGAVLGIPTLGSLGGAALQRCDSLPLRDAALAAEVKPVRRMLAVLQFCEDDDMAFVLDRMFTCINPMRARLASGRCFLRFVVIEDLDQRFSICNALNQWMLSSAEKASGIPADFSSSLELTNPADDVAGSSVARTCPERESKGPSPAFAASTEKLAQATQPILKPDSIHSAPHLDSGAAKNLHCPHPLPSGF
jgi:hypothetical protein